MNNPNAAPLSTVTPTPSGDREVVQLLTTGRAQIEAELGKVIVGQREVIEQLLIALFAGGHCLITGAPGLAKTLLVKSIAQIFHLKFQRIQFTPDLMPTDITPAQAAITYATEADLLNVALFGQAAQQWRAANPKLEGNMRDYATIEQLLVLANIEGMNAEFIHMQLPQGERLKRLNQIAIRQMQTLTAISPKALPGTKDK